MHLKRSFAVIGGDLRQRCLLRQLRGLGFPASAYRVPDAEDSAPDLSGCLRGANVLILPMPAGGGVPLADILDAAEPGALICGGIGAGARLALEEAGIRLYPGAVGSADEAVRAFLSGTLQYQPDLVCSHHKDAPPRVCGSHTCSAACYHEQQEEPCHEPN